MFQEETLTVLRRPVTVDQTMDLYNKINRSKVISADLIPNLPKDVFDASDSMESLLDLLNQTLEMVVSETTTEIVNNLINYDVYAVDEETFLSKYYGKYFDCSNIIAPLVEKYLAILDQRDELERYREYERENRARWSGGGFGVRGAIKGAITAEIMNCGSDFLYSIKTSGQKTKDARYIQKLKSELYHSAETYKFISDAFQELFDAFFYCETLEFIANGVIEDRGFDSAAARAIFNNTMKRKDQLPEDKLLKLLGDVFQKDPYYYPLYQYMFETGLDQEDDNSRFNRRASAGTQQIRHAQLAVEDNYC